MPEDATLECGDELPLPADVTATDNCGDGTASVIYGQTFAGDGVCGDPNATGTYTRTWTATDCWGLTTTDSQDIVVTDNTPPTLVGVPADATVECDAIPGPATVTATDSCDPDPTVSFNEDSDLTGCNGTGTITRTWTATDCAGNSVSQTQTITVQDTTAPVLLVPDDTTIDCEDPTDPSETGMASATDNCGTPVVTYTDAVDPVGCPVPDTITINRTWKATDDCGNSTSAVQIITRTECTPKLIIIKEVDNDPDGVLEPEDFPIDVDGTALPTSSIVVRADNPFEDCVDPLICGYTMLDLCPGDYEVTETLGELADFYEDPVLTGDCDDSIDLGQTKTCTVRNTAKDFQNQLSIELSGLTATGPEGGPLPGSSSVHGEFTINDESEGGNRPDGFLILMDDYAVDFEYRSGRRVPYEPSDPDGQFGGSFEVNGETVSYTCEYTIVARDLDPPTPLGWTSGDPFIFDEKTTIGYSCDLFDEFGDHYLLPNAGFLRATATAGVHSRPGRVFTFRQEFKLR